MRKIDTPVDSFSIIIPKNIWRSAVTKFGGENDEQEEEHDEDDNSGESEDENAENACGLAQHIDVEGGDEDSGSDDELSEPEREDEQPARVNRENGAGTSESVVRTRVLNRCA